MLSSFDGGLTVTCNTPVGRCFRLSLFPGRVPTPPSGAARVGNPVPTLLERITCPHLTHPGHKRDA